MGPGNPRFVEITNCGPIDVIFDSSDWLAVYFDGSDVPGVAVSLGGYGLASGESLVIASSVNGGDQAFFDAYGFHADVYTVDMFGDGNDVYALQHGVWVLDTYGAIGVNGVGSGWFYEDSYAYSLFRFQNYGCFDEDNWVYGLPGGLDAPTDPERVTLLRALTTPGTHDCDGIPPGLSYSRGDLNCDGLVNGLDIGPFVLAMTSAPTYAAYYAAFPHCNPMLADCDLDRTVNVLDIHAFVSLLTGSPPYLIIMGDNFETDLGWTVENDPSLTDGAWERGLPADDGTDGDPTEDYDSGKCCLTGNRLGNSDVDGGPTSLTSPVLDLSSTTDPVVRFAEWMSCDDAGAPDEDYLDVYMTSDGTNWAQVAHIDSHDGWVVHSVYVTDFVPLTDTFQLRFSVQDVPNSSNTEAGIDSVSVFDPQ